jgi:hypothetical protein
MVCSLAVGTEEFRSRSVFTRDSGEGSAAGGELVATPNEGFFSLETTHHRFGREEGSSARAWTVDWMWV